MRICLLVLISVSSLWWPSRVELAPTLASTTVQNSTELLRLKSTTNQGIITSIKPVVSTSTRIKTSTTSSASSIYDDYDENYDDVYDTVETTTKLNSILLNQSKPLAAASTTSTSRPASTKPASLGDDYDYDKDYVEKEELGVKSTTPSSTTQTQASSKSKPKQIKIVSNSKTTKKGGNDYDFSDYYEHYDDYADTATTTKALASTTTQRPNILVLTTKQIKLINLITTTLVQNSTLTKKSNVYNDYDESDYYDYLEDSTTTKSVGLKKKTDTNSSLLRTSTVSTIRQLNTTTRINKKKMTQQKSTKSGKATAGSSTKQNEYDEYYEDDYYENNKENYDYYSEDDYEYNEAEGEANSTNSGKTRPAATTSTVQPLNDKSDNSTSASKMPDPVFKTKSNTTHANSDEYDSSYEDYDEESDTDQYDEDDEPIQKANSSLSTTSKSPEPSSQSSTESVVFKKLDTTTELPETTTFNEEDNFLKEIEEEDEEEEEDDHEELDGKDVQPPEEKEEEEIISYFNEDSIESEESRNDTSITGVLTLKELIKSPALLAGIFGGLLLGIVTALLLLIFIIYRVRKRKFDDDSTYGLSGKIKRDNLNYMKTNDQKKYKKTKLAKSKSRNSNKHQAIVSHHGRSQTGGNCANPNVMSSSSLSTPSNTHVNSSSSSSSNSNATVTTSLLNSQTLINNSRLLKYANNNQTNSLRLVSSILSSSESTGSTINHEGSFNYAYIKAPTKEFYA